MSRDDDPAALHWIKAQADKGAMVIGVCVGAKVVAAAGLLDGRRGTTRWFSVDELLDEHPSITHVKDRRFVIDRGVATTTGISASMPMSLTLIEAIAGRDKAVAVARDLGVAEWDARHVSAAFQFTRRLHRPLSPTRLRYGTASRSASTSHGADEVSLALVADAWSRTYRSRAVTTAVGAGAVATRSGLRIVPDRVAAVGNPVDFMLPAVGDRPAAQALPRSSASRADTAGGRPTWWRCSWNGRPAVRSRLAEVELKSARGDARRACWPFGGGMMVILTWKP
jgi:putative intracellular protease/amidase